MDKFIDTMEKSIDDISEELSLSIQTHNYLIRCGINSIIELLKYKILGVFEKRPMIKKVEKEICMVLNFYGIDFTNTEKCKELVQKYNLVKSNPTYQTLTEENNSLKEQINNVDNMNSLLEAEIMSLFQENEHLNTQLAHKKEVYFKLLSLRDSIKEIIDNDEKGNTYIKK